ENQSYRHPLRLSAMNGRTGRSTEWKMGIATLVVGILALVVGGVALWRTRDEKSSVSTTAKTTVTTGKPPGQPVKVPDLTNKNGYAAAASLKNAGLKSKVETANSATVPKGNVISQDPAAAANAVTGATITLTISKGP